MTNDFGPTFLKYAKTNVSVSEERSLQVILLVLERRLLEYYTHTQDYNIRVKFKSLLVAGSVPSGYIVQRNCMWHLSLGWQHWQLLNTYAITEKEELLLIS
jgi:hypothetical protein